MDNLKIGDILIYKKYGNKSVITSISFNPLTNDSDIIYTQYSATYRKDIPIYFDLVEKKKGHILTSVFK